MTLDTRIALERGNAKEVFAFLRELIGTPADIPVRTEKDETWGSSYGFPFYANPIGIGMPGILTVHYGKDGPMLTKPYIPEGKTEPNPDDEAYRLADPAQNGWAGIEVSFDTGYGYQADNGAGCSDLHAWFVSALGDWCDERGIDWQWQDEFQGTWHHADRREHLTEFGDADRGRLVA